MEDKVDRHHKALFCFMDLHAPTGIGWTPMRDHRQNIGRSTKLPVLARDAGQAIFKCPESVPARAQPVKGTTIIPPLAV
eukprot:6209396-Pleurochrysis_carterae.AAC.4